MKTKAIPKTFEARMERLQVIVNIMEKGEAPLEESVALYKEGMELSAACRKQLEKARHDIRLYGEKGEENFTVDTTLEQNTTAGEE